MGKIISVQEVLRNFDFKIINKGKPDTTYITTSGIARIGIELATNIKPLYKKQNSVVCLGSSELNYLKQLKPAQLKKTIRKLKKLNPPLIILNDAFKPENIKCIMKAMGKTHITIASIPMSSTELYFEVSPFIAKKIAPSTQLHGTLMSVYGVGVFIVGDSGCGKSEAAMELIKTGHLFVGDDAIEVYNFGQSLFAHPTEVAKQFIEVRGLGILDVARMFGRQKTLHESEVHMIVELVNPEKSVHELNKFERVGDKQHYEKIRGVSLPKYYIPVTAGRPTASLIESAVVDYKLKVEGYNAGQQFINNFNNVLAKGDKK